MAKHTTVRRGAADQEEDVFVARTLEATAWASRHSQLLIVTAVALAMLIAGFFYYRNFRARIADTAAARLNEIRQTAASGNRALAEKDLETFVQKFKGTPAAAEGRVILAQTLLEEGKAQQAGNVARPLAAELDAPLGPTAAFLVAAAQEADGKGQQAEASYLHIADTAPFDYQRRDALQSAARLKTEKGDEAGAAALYQRLLKMTPDSLAQHSIYQMRLAEAQAAASDGAARK